MSKDKVILQSCIILSNICSRKSEVSHTRYKKAFSDNYKGLQYIQKYNF